MHTQLVGENWSAKFESAEKKGVIVGILTVFCRKVIVQQTLHRLTAFFLRKGITPEPLYH